MGTRELMSIFPSSPLPVDFPRTTRAVFQHLLGRLSQTGLLGAANKGQADVAHLLNAIADTDQPALSQTPEIRTLQALTNVLAAKDDNA